MVPLGGLFVRQDEGCVAANQGDRQREEALPAHTTLRPAVRGPFVILSNPLQPSL